MLDPHVCLTCGAHVPGDATPPALGLIGVGLEPPLAIGQRALLVRTPEGSVLWDCVPLLHDGTVLHWRDGKDVVRRSVVRYRQALEGRLDSIVLPWPETDGD